MTAGAATATLARISFPALGTTATLLVDGDEDAMLAAHQVLMAELDAFDATCSRFRSDSELSVLNRAAGQTVPASPLLIAAVEAALRAAELTGGLVDPTIGRALRLLGYDRDFAALDPEGPPVTVTAEQVAGWQAVRLDRARGTISIPVGVELDLGATAKALAADRAARRAVRAAGTGVLVSLGGDVSVAGPAPAGGWSVRVSDDHAAPEGPGDQTICLTSGGLATSGTTVRRWRRGQAEVHHLVDPSTGLPAATVWRTASVVAGCCLDANSASTAAIVLGARAPQWLEERSLPARLVSPSGQVRLVAGWPAPTVGPVPAPEPEP